MREIHIHGSAAQKIAQVEQHWILPAKSIGEGCNDHIGAICLHAVSCEGRGGEADCDPSSPWSDEAVVLYSRAHARCF